MLEPRGKGLQASHDSGWRRCPRCAIGWLMLGRDFWGDYFSCVMCGVYLDAQETSAGFRSVPSRVGGRPERASFLDDEE